MFTIEVGVWPRCEPEDDPEQSPFLSSWSLPCLPQLASDCDGEFFYWMVLFVRFLQDLEGPLLQCSESIPLQKVKDTVDLLVETLFCYDTSRMYTRRLYQFQSKHRAEYNAAGQELDGILMYVSM